MPGGYNMNTAEIRRDVLERFMRYCKIDSGSVHDAGIVPSSPGQMVMAWTVGKDAAEMGYQVDFLPFGVRARAKANVEGVAPIAYGAHLDTSCDAPNSGIEVLVHENYDGKDIVLENGIVLSPNEMPKLRTYVGDTILTSNGRTLLSSDDKSGVASLVTFMRYLKESDEKHGDIDFLFTYDEETGLDGALLLSPITDTAAKYAFLFDNGYRELGVDTFNAASAYLEVPKIEGEVSGTKATIKIAGKYTFPGHGKAEGMIDAYRNLPEVVGILTDVDVPVTAIKGNAGEIQLEVLLQESVDLQALSQITDSRLKDGRAPVTVDVSTERGSASAKYDLGSVACLVVGIPYEMSAEQTEKRVGYVQPLMFSERDGKTVLRTLLRDFETTGLEAKKDLVRGLAPVTIKDEYKNMATVLAETPGMVELTKEAMTLAGVTNIEIKETRGGTEAAVYTLSNETMNGNPQPGRRIPAVNIGALGEGYHSVREYQSVRALEQAVQTAIHINRLVVSGKHLP